MEPFCTIFSIIVTISFQSQSRQGKTTESSPSNLTPPYLRIRPVASTTSARPSISVGLPLNSPRSPNIGTMPVFQYQLGGVPMLSQNIEGFSNLTPGSDPTISGTQPTNAGTQPTIAGTQPASGPEPISAGFNLSVPPSAHFHSPPVFPGVESQSLIPNLSHGTPHDQSSANEKPAEGQPISEQELEGNHGNVDLQMYQHLYNSPNLQQQDFNFG